MGVPKKPLDPAFKVYALGHSKADAIEHFNISDRMYRRWCRECDIVKQIAARGRPTFRKVPEDFHVHAASESNAELCVRYACGERLIARWRREVKIRSKPIPTEPAPANFAALASTMYKSQAEKYFNCGDYKLERWARETGARFKQPFRFKPMPQPKPVIDDGVAGRAAQHLRRLMPVYKARVIDPKRDGYIVGKKHMQADEMIAFAQKKGWAPDEWSRL